MAKTRLQRRAASMSKETSTGQRVSAVLVRSLRSSVQWWNTLALQSITTSFSSFFLYSSLIRLKTMRSLQDLFSLSLFTALRLGRMPPMHSFGRTRHWLQGKDPSLHPLCLGLTSWNRTSIVFSKNGNKSETTM